MAFIDYKGNKAFRLLNIYERLNKGELIDKTAAAANFGVTHKTIQRDIDDLRAYFAETHFFEKGLSIKYDRVKKGYYLVRFEREWLTNSEVLALCKILLESRAFEKGELSAYLDKLIAQVAPLDRKSVEAIIKNERHNYVPLKHGKKLLSVIWTLSCYINAKEIISFSYRRQDGKSASHTVKPVAIMFSEFYFYLVAFMAEEGKTEKKYPTLFRIDRIKNIKSAQQKFDMPYKDKFNDGEFRKRIQFMYSGELKKVKFEFSGPSLEAVLDRLPTAKILSTKCGVCTLEAETYGDGVLMWLRSQGEWVRMLSA